MGTAKPQGIIDITADVRYPAHSKQLDVTVGAEPRSETCSLEPVQFPYRFENVQGVFTYSRGCVTFDRCSAWHGPVKLACGGTCRFQPSGGWSCAWIASRLIACGWTASSCRPCRCN